ncbi:NADPH--cytochrome P450 reductase [Diutina catenulata]
MALDKLDFAVIIGLAVAVAAYFAKDSLFPKKVDEGGFLNTESFGSDRNIIKKLADTGKNCIVFYGSQTGTAEDYANKLSKELSARFGLKTMSADLGSYDFENFDEIANETLVFFICATYGEGEPTDDAVDFVEWLDNEADTLSTLRYSVFGLGNSTYEFFNAVGRKINQKLEDKGAEQFSPYGEGDDGVGTLDEDYLEWKDKVFDTLKNDLNFEEKELVYEPGLDVKEDDSLSESDLEVSVGEPNKTYLESGADLTKGPFNQHHPYLAPITFTKELFNSPDRSCVQVDFDISASNLRYSTGDHLAVWPSNCDENVDTFFKAIGIPKEKRNTVVQVKPLDSTISLHFPSPTTYEAIVRHYLEISGPISRQFFLSVAQFAPDDHAKKEVTRLGGDKTAYASEIVKKNFNMADALLYISNGSTWKIPFNFLIESIPHLQPRYYSISSSSLADKTNIGITAVVEWEKEADGRVVTGVATNLLKNIEVEKNKTGGSLVAHYDLAGPREKFSKFKLPVHVRRSTFKLPSNPQVPVIMIGPGTGVAPFRGFIRDRVQLKEQGQSPGKMLLFYGCRKEKEDYLYREEWPNYANKLDSNLQVYTAFSRDDPSNKVYVQDRLLEQAETINKLLEDGAFIYVCGDASKMARDVQSTLGKIISNQRSISEEKGAELISSYKVQNRYQEDVW